MKDSGSFPTQVEQTVRRVQHWRCFLIASEPIKVFHHEPPDWELLARGVKTTDSVEYSFGVSLAGHGAIHELRYRLFKFESDLNAAAGIRGVFTPRDKELYGKLLDSPEDCERIEGFILRRREKYLGVKISG